MRWLLFSWLLGDLHGQGVLICVLKVMIKEWFDYGTPHLNDCVELDPTLTSVAVACLCEIDGMPLLHTLSFLTPTGLKNCTVLVAWH